MKKKKKPVQFWEFPYFAQTTRGTFILSMDLEPVVEFAMFPGLN